MSHAGPRGRAIPRWSTVTPTSHRPGVPVGMTSRSGEPGRGSRVRVGPPLSVNGPRPDARFARSDGAPSPQLVSADRFQPDDATAALQSLPGLSSTVPDRVTAPAGIDSAAPSAATLAVIVLDVITDP